MFSVVLMAFMQRVDIPSPLRRNSFFNLHQNIGLLGYKVGQRNYGDVK